MDNKKRDLEKNTNTEEVMEMKTRALNEILPGIEESEKHAGTKGTNAYGSAGYRLFYKEEGEEKWTNIPNVVELETPQAETDDIETTDHDSGMVKEYLPGLIDYGEATFTINAYDKEVIAELFRLRDSRKPLDWAILSPGAYGFLVEFSGNLKQFDHNSPSVDGEAITATGVVKVSGEAKGKFVNE